VNSVEPERSTAYGLGSVALVAALVLVIWLAWHGNPSADASYTLGRANGLLQQSRYGEAQALLEGTLKTFTGPQVRLSLSYVYLAQRNVELAERQARLALVDASPPLRPLILTQLGRVLRFAGRADDALLVWNQATQESASYPESPQATLAGRSALWQTAMTQWARQDWDASRSTLQELAGENDLYGRSADVKLAQLLAPGDPDGSLNMEARAKASGDSPMRPAIPDLRVPGLAEGLPGDVITSTLTTLDNARAQVAQALSRGDPEAAIRTLWAGMYLQQGENGLAQSLLEKVKPDYAPAQTRLALAMLNQGDTAGALPHLQKSIALDGRDPLTRHVLVRLYTAKGDWALAEEQLRVLDTLEPDGIETHLDWAEFYRLQGDFDKAEGEYIAATNAQIVASTLAASGGQSQDADGSTANAALTLARFYTDVRGLGCDKGLPAARQVILLRPTDPDSLDAVGWALVLCGQSSQALSSLEGAIARAPDVPRYRFHLARAYAGLARYADAREQFARVRDLDPGGPWEKLALTAMVSLPR
jgi:tetratricopeptide (TPR) repeat protein